jgi:hypothetical protein
MGPAAGLYTVWHLLLRLTGAHAAKYGLARQSGLLLRLQQQQPMLQQGLPVTSWCTVQGMLQ